MKPFTVNPVLKELLRQGKYTVYSPSKDQPELISVFYATGDLMCFVDAEKLTAHPELAEEHLKQLGKLVKDTRLPLAILERIWLFVWPFISVLFSLRWEKDFLWKFGLFLLVSALSYLTKSAFARIFLKLVTVRLRKSLGI